MFITYTRKQCGKDFHAKGVRLDWGFKSNNQLTSSHQNKIIMFYSIEVEILNNSFSSTHEKFPVINRLISYCSSKIRSQITIENQLAGWQQIHRQSCAT